MKSRSIRNLASGCAMRPSYEPDGSKRLFALHSRLYDYSRVMYQPAKLSPEEVSSALPSLPGWSVVEGKLHREYKFSDFVSAFGFMAAAATVAEKLDHHPDWSNVYNRVTVDLSTHDAGGITSLDIQLAERMEKLAQKLQ